MIDERWANVAPYSSLDGEHLSFPKDEFPKKQDVRDWLAWSDPDSRWCVHGPDFVEVHDHSEEACPADPCPNLSRIMAWSAELK